MTLAAVGTVYIGLGVILWVHAIIGHSQLGLLETHDQFGHPPNGPR